MKKYFLFLAAYFIFPFIGVSNGYEIKVEIKGVSDTVIYLGHHSGSQKLVIDTTYIDNRGRAIFSNKDRELHRGIYFIVMPSRGMELFEILIAHDRIFSIKTDTANFVENMRIRGCRENVLFNKYQKSLGELQKTRMKLNEKVSLYEEDDEKMSELREKFQELNEQRIELIKAIIEDNPDAFFGTVLSAMLDIEVPDPPLDESGEPIDPDFRYHYVRNHYFDNIDFSERGLIRTPILANRINSYFENMVVPVPDSLISEANRVIQMSYDAGDSLVFRSVTAQLLRFFETSRIMGYDAVFVDIAENWYLSGKAYWASEEFLERLHERVVRISPTLIGNITPNLMRMQTLERSFVSLHSIDADYTILVFWEPECGHCRTLIPKLFKEYEDTLRDLNVKIFAVYTQYDREEWEKFINNNDITTDGWYNVWDGPRPHSNFRNLYDIYSTPVVIVLDQDKRILAKRVGAEDIVRVIEFDKRKKENNNQ